MLVQFDGLMLPDAPDVTLVAHGDVAVVAAQHHLRALGDDIAVAVDTGIDTREIVSGIAEHFTPEELVGRQVLVLVNLAPRELKGTLSRGMVLMAEDADGKLVLLSPEKAVKSGSIVG